MQEFAPFKLEVLHIIGGGSLNKYLNQFTANATGATVLAGPQEGTAIGNIMLQACERHLGDASNYSQQPKTREIRADGPGRMGCSL